MRGCTGPCGSKKAASSISRQPTCSIRRSVTHSTIDEPGHSREGEITHFADCEYDAIADVSLRLPYNTTLLPQDLADIGTPEDTNDKDSAGA